jgi:hypothetical protein
VSVGNFPYIPLGATEEVRWLSHCFISRLQIFLLLRGKMHGGARVTPEGAIVDSSASSAAKPSSVLSSAHKQMATSVRRHEFCCVRTLSWRAQGSPTLLLVPSVVKCVAYDSPALPIISYADLWTWLTLASLRR